MTIVRPSIVFGPNVDNYIVRGFANNPFMPVMDGVDQDFQLVHEDDVAAALIALLDGKHAGAFNLAGDGLLTWGRAGELIGKKTREVSLKNMKRFNGAMWRLHIPRTEAPPGNLDFIRFPWVVSAGSRPTPGASSSAPCRSRGCPTSAPRRRCGFAATSSPPRDPAERAQALSGRQTRW
jgi:nucleoside-diphosphate-sugar epimerase